LKFNIYYPKKRHCACALLAAFNRLWARLRLGCAIPLKSPIVKTWIIGERGSLSQGVGLIPLSLSIFSPPINCSIYCGGVLKFNIYYSKERHCVCALLAAFNSYICKLFRMMFLLWFYFLCCYTQTVLLATVIFIYFNSCWHSVSSTF